MQAPTLDRPKLQKPGAGLPWLETKFLRFFMPRLASRTSWEESQRRFLSHTQKMHAIIQSLPDDKLNQQVLVPRLRALEDSSRFWSIAMTAEHLRITAPFMCNTIIGLCGGQRPDKAVRVADVKPPEKQQSGAVLAKAFLEEMTAIHERLSAPGLKHDSTTTGPHPWFGEINAHQWNWVIAAHHGLHRSQMREILKRL